MQVFFVCFLFFPWFWFSSLFFFVCSGFVFLFFIFFVKPYILCVVGLISLDLLSSKSFSSLIFFLFPFSSLTRPTFSFAFVHTVGNLTSKTSFNQNKSKIARLYQKEINENQLSIFKSGYVKSKLQTFQNRGFVWHGWPTD